MFPCVCSVLSCICDLQSSGSFGLRADTPELNKSIQKLRIVLQFFLPLPRDDGRSDSILRRADNKIYRYTSTFETTDVSRRYTSAVSFCYGLNHIMVFPGNRLDDTDGMDNRICIAFCGTVGLPYEVVGKEGVCRRHDTSQYGREKSIKL